MAALVGVALLGLISAMLILVPVSTAPARADSPAAVVPVDPQRLWDTRAREPAGVSGVPQRALERYEPVEVPVAGLAGVPTDAVGAVLNVAAVRPEVSGHLTVWPCAAEVPGTSSLNTVRGRVVANQITMALSPQGTVCVRASTRTDLVLDVTGFLPKGSLLGVGDPLRLADTRPSEGGAGRLPARGVLQVGVAGEGPVPDAAGVAVLNVTVVSADGHGHATVYPCDGGRPTASSLNFEPGVNVANAVWARLAADGTVCVFTSAPAHVVVDAVGGQVAGSEGVQGVTPYRVVDTRSGFRGIDRLAAGRPVEVSVPGLSTDAGYAGPLLLNVTVTRPEGAGWLVAWPCDRPKQLASNVNYRAGQSIPNAVLVAVGTTGRVCVAASTPTDLVIDVNGYVNPPGSSYAPAPIDPPPPPPPPAPTPPTPLEQMVAAVNQARAVGRSCGGYGWFGPAPALGRNAALDRAAAGHSADMAVNDFFSHTGSGGSTIGTRVSAVGYGWSRVGENIAAGYRTAQEAVDGLLASPGHCRNIMDGRFTEIGVGVANGGSYGVYWTQVFARPW